ncbi:hypothetical protein H5410_001263 [Solanum commersonii]|uniref:F-box associated domain-containing protein n=1 Tax=Solanum commersonii TaxID=4109 RepID=A0A9J6AZ22_SOLCO|nr:hypothetical protein H5410_001263 [Solanum commersonii]
MNSFRQFVYPKIQNMIVKSLLHFQSISKSWNAIISDEEFKKALCPRKLLLVQKNDGVFEFRDLKNPQIAIGKQEFPLKRFRNPIVMCLCDCLENKNFHYRTFLCPFLNGMTLHGCGLCYDSGDDDYKVILIYKSCYAIYHVKRNRWTKKTIVVNLVRARDHEIVMRVITYYDVKSDELKELQIPYYISGQGVRLTSLKGCVCLYGIRRDLDVWIMEQDGWTRLMRINCNNSDFRDQLISNIVLSGSKRNGEILFQVGWRLERLVMYDPKRHKFIQKVRIFEDSKQEIIPICSESFYFPIET